MFIAGALAVGGIKRGNERQIDSIIHLCLFFQMSTKLVGF